jgi:hypothetical protein
MLEIIYWKLPEVIDDIRKLRPPRRQLDTRYEREIERALLGPSFWQALCKARGGGEAIRMAIPNGRQCGTASSTTLQKGRARRACSPRLHNPSLWLGIVGEVLVRSAKLQTIYLEKRTRKQFSVVHVKKCDVESVVIEQALIPNPIVTIRLK